ncbi:MFS transporter [Oceanibacterium hippocampi]|uniref:Major Facilitator Superfamily protein n=1 Tax=Oceanibacterium hippocampi TaxID=745714 RepID=A0A1Y5SPB5_9PROT|nr:MFS transporter [Oceanibacterium hippocampi]SLN45213.1 Major Facilitator Superfamily protein [Oceanibacterium hippocampi]
MKRYANQCVILFGGIAHSYAHLFTLLFATVVLGMEGMWGLSYAELFALAVPATVMFGVGALPAGWIADRWSATGMIVVFFLGIGASAVIVGLADSPFQVAAGLTLLGTFASIYHPVGIPWLVAHAANPGRALGISGVFGSLGTAGAALVAGFLVAHGGWRIAFLVPGAVALGSGVLFLLADRSGWFDATRHAAASSAPVSKGDTRRVFAVLAVTVLCSGLIFQSTAFALPKIFEERLSDFVNGNVLGIGGLVTACYLLSALTQIIGGELADRYSLRSIYWSVQLLQLPVIAVAFMLHNPALVAVAALMIGFNVAGQPAENALLARHTPEAWRGRAFGAKFVLTLGVSALGVALIPVIHAMTGRLDYLFIALFAFAAIAALAAYRLPRPAAIPAAVPAE